VIFLYKYPLSFIIGVSMKKILHPRIQQKVPKYLNSSGYSLLEVLLAVAILTVGMLATTSLALGIINGNSVSKEVTTASNLAQDKIESLREAGYKGLPSADTTVIEDYGTIQFTVDGESVNYSGYKRTTTTQINSPMAGMKTVTVSVFWDSKPIPITFITYIAR